MGSEHLTVECPCLNRCNVHKDNATLRAQLDDLMTNVTVARYAALKAERDALVAALEESQRVLEDCYDVLRARSGNVLVNLNRLMRAMNTNRAALASVRSVKGER